MIRPEVAAWSDVGKERTLNEDRVFYQVLESSDADPVVICIVADGMGGHLGGEVASHWAVETLKRELADLFMPTDPRQTVQMTGAEMRAVVREATGKIRPSDVVLMRRLRKAVERANQAVRQYTFHRPQEAMGRSIRTDRYRLVEWTGTKIDEPIYELYDYAAEAPEQVNLAGDPDCQPVVKELLEMLHSN